MEVDVVDGTMLMRLGFLSSRLCAPQHLRFCPACVEDERDEFGECYWHRVHQTPGIEVCPVHAVWLESSLIQIPEGDGAYAAEDTVPIVPSRRLSPSDPGAQSFLGLARDTAWLLRHSPGGDPLDLHRRYISLLTNRGLAWDTGRIRAHSFLKLFRGSYPKEVLRHYGVQKDAGQKTDHLMRLVRKPTTIQHPLHHLLLIQFLGHTAETFWQIPGDPSLFGSGPWPCLNPLANHFHQRVIRACNIQWSERNGRPIATFRCVCGFTYQRTGPDWSEMAQFTTEKIIDYGPIWKKNLKKQWRAGNSTVGDIARQLGVTHQRLISEATKLGLVQRKRGSKGSRKIAFTTKLEQSRKAWMAALALCQQTQIPLRTSFPRLYRWLLRKDALWLKKHALPRQPFTPPPRLTVDWQQRDEQCLTALLKAASDIQSDPEAGRLTKSALIRRTGLSAYLPVYLPRLPRAQAAILRLLNGQKQDQPEDPEPTSPLEGFEQDVCPPSIDEPSETQRTA